MKRRRRRARSETSYAVFTLEALVPRMEVPPEHVSVREAARILGVPESSMHHYVQRGLIPAVRVTAPPRTTGLPYRIFVDRADAEKLREHVRVPLPGEMTTWDAARTIGINPNLLKKWGREGRATPDRVVRTAHRKWFFWTVKTVGALKERLAARPLRGDEIFVDDVCEILGFGHPRVTNRHILRFVRDGVLRARMVQDGSVHRLVFIRSEVEALKAWYIRKITAAAGWRKFLEARTRKDAHKYWRRS